MPNNPKIVTWFIQAGFLKYSIRAGKNTVIAPTIKIIPVTTSDEYLESKGFAIIAPITQEMDAKIIKIFPKKASGEMVPVKIWGTPMITKAPKNPKKIPAKFTK